MSAKVEKEIPVSLNPCKLHHLFTYCFVSFVRILKVQVACA